MQQQQQQNEKNWPWIKVKEASKFTRLSFCPGEEEEEEEEEKLTVEVPRETCRALAPSSFPWT
jgi:hypothetical protein